jgi:hypothetical protein
MDETSVASGLILNEATIGSLREQVAMRGENRAEEKGKQEGGRRRGDRRLYNSNLIRNG